MALELEKKERNQKDRIYMVFGTLKMFMVLAQI